VVLDPLPGDKRFADVEALGIVTASAFGQRRKTLRRSLAQAAGQTGASSEDLLTAAGIDPGARAETVDVAGFRRLAEAWRAAKG
jgi:16S rRNA (adenine1518-N6/adenine1519-N6)-dimethyltransferase